MMEPELTVLLESYLAANLRANACKPRVVILETLEYFIFKKVFELSIYTVYERVEVGFITSPCSAINDG
jgi:hypothetical protein